MRDEARLHDRPIGVTRLQTTSIWPWSILLKSWNLISAIILISLDNGTLSLRSSNYALFTLVPLSIRAIPSLQLFKSDSSSSSLSSSAFIPLPPFHPLPSPAWLVPGELSQFSCLRIFACATFHLLLLVWKYQHQDHYLPDHLWLNSSLLLPISAPWSLSNRAHPVLFNFK